MPSTCASTMPTTHEPGRIRTLASCGLIADLRRRAVDHVKFKANELANSPFGRVQDAMNPRSHLPHACAPSKHDNPRRSPRGCRA